MALNTTTLSAACGVNDTTVTVASTTGISAPVLPVGPFTVLLVGFEVMFVTAVNTTTGVCNVNRGYFGTKATAHATSTPVAALLSTDPANIVPMALQTIPPINPAIGAPLTGATITPDFYGLGTMNHFTGTTALVTITVPANLLATQVTLIFDGSASGLTWTAAGNISVAGTATTAKSSVTFQYDVSTAKWIPSRLA